MRWRAETEVAEARDENRKIVQTAIIINGLIILGWAATAVFKDDPIIQMNIIQTVGCLSIPVLLADAGMAMSHGENQAKIEKLK